MGRGRAQGEGNGNCRKRFGEDQIAGRCVRGGQVIEGPSCKLLSSAIGRKQDVLYVETFEWWKVNVFSASNM